MTLKNLLGISLDAVAPDKALITKLFAAARRNIADARLQDLSAENRFDVAYKAIMQVAIAGLNANGFRTLTSKPGHHQTAIQTLNLTLGLPQQKLVLLDALCKQRNLSDYSGDPIPNAIAAECLTSAQELLAHARAWLKSHKPDLL